jgi:WD domain, G-beta repeat
LARHLRGLNFRTATSLPLPVIAFSPDSRLLASGDGQGLVRLWDVETGVPRQVLRGRGKMVRQAGFCDGGQRVFSLDLDMVLKLWDVDSGQEVLTTPAPGLSLAFSPDSHRLAFGGPNTGVTLWDASPGPLRRVLRHQDTVEYPTFSPDGRYVAAAANDGSVRLWDAESGQVVLAFTEPGTTDGRVFFTTDGGKLLFRTPQRQRVAWELLSGRPVPGDLADLRSDNPRRVSPDGRTLLTVSGGLVRLIDLRPSDDEIALGPRLMNTDWAGPDPNEPASEGAYRTSTQAGLHAVAFFHSRHAARAYAERGRWADAAAALLRTRGMPPEQTAPSRRELAVAQLAAGRTDDYRRTCERLLTLCENQEVGGGEPVSVDVARACVLRPDALPAAGWTSLAAKRIDDPIVQAAVLHRAGRHAEALASLGKDTGPYALLVRALAERAAGRIEAARTAAQQAGAWLDAVPDPPRWDGTNTRAAELPWDRRVELDALRREVESVIDGPAR